MSVVVVVGMGFLSDHHHELGCQKKMGMTVDVVITPDAKVDRAVASSVVMMSWWCSGEKRLGKAGERTHSCNALPCSFWARERDASQDGRRWERLVLYCCVRYVCECVDAMAKR